MNIPVGALVQVKWRDAYFDFEEPDEQREDYLVYTVGYVVNVSDKFLSIAQEQLPEQDGWRAVTHVPLPVVLDWKPL